MLVVSWHENQTNYLTASHQFALLARLLFLFNSSRHLELIMMDVLNTKIWPLCNGLAVPYSFERSL